jgi:putative ABC transport system ATP-binding protein
VIFADEPTGNLDSTTSQEILGLLRRAVDEFGQAVVMVTHDAAAAAVADRVVFLADGAVVADDSGLDADQILDRMKALA